MYNRSDPSSLADRISKTDIDTNGDDNSVNIGNLGFETPRKVLVVWCYFLSTFALILPIQCSTHMLPFQLVATI